MMAETFDFKNQPINLILANHTSLSICKGGC